MLRVGTSQGGGHAGVDSPWHEGTNECKQFVAARGEPALRSSQWLQTALQCWGMPMWCACSPTVSMN